MASDANAGPFLGEQRRRKDRCQGRRSGAVAQHLGLYDAPHSRFETLVLPDTDNRPTSLLEQAVCVAISLLVRQKLPLPPLRIGPRTGPVFNASVPETTVYEDCDLEAGERDVDGSASRPRDRVLNAVTQAERMEHAPEGQFL